MSSPSAFDNSNSSVHLVIQRFRTAKLLVDDESTVVVTAGHDGNDDDRRRASSHDQQDIITSPSLLIHPLSNVSSGLLVYVSFSKTATRSKVRQAAKILLHLPLLTHGAWGDGSDTKSVLDMAKERYQHEDDSGSVAVMIVPQANLISKIKSQGRSIQYHGQIDKDTGRELYDHFCQCVRAMSLERQYECEQQKVPEYLAKFTSSDEQVVNSSATSRTVDPSVPPEELFRQENDKYGSWDNVTGLPLTTISGEPLTKSTTKKLRKQVLAHAKRHEKWKQKQERKSTEMSSSEGVASKEEDGATDTDMATSLSSGTQSFSELKHSFIHVVQGSFGKRQGLEFISDMGPFCHVVNV